MMDRTTTLVGASRPAVLGHGDRKRSDDPVALFETRHDLAFAGDGFVLPHLVISPASGGMNLRWSPTKPRFVNLEFAGSGQARVPAEDPEQEFRALIEAVIDKLQGENLELPALAEAWEAVDALDPEEREFVHAAASLGVDPCSSHRRRACGRD